MSAHAGSARVDAHRLYRCVPPRLDQSAPRVLTQRDMMQYVSFGPDNDSSGCFWGNGLTCVWTSGASISLLDD